MQLLRSDDRKRDVDARMGIAWVSGLERILRVASLTSIFGIMMSLRISWGFSLVAFFAPSAPLRAVITENHNISKGLFRGPQAYPDYFLQRGLFSYLIIDSFSMPPPLSVPHSQKACLSMTVSIERLIS